MPGEQPVDPTSPDRYLELRQPDGRLARVQDGVLIDAWLDYMGQQWTLNPEVAAALALSVPEPGEGEVVAGLRRECRLRLGMEGEQ